jgi:uncharacterized cupin superfamily protein
MSASAAVIPLDPATRVEPWEPFPAEEILSGVREQSGRIVFEDSDLGLSVGLWEQEANETNWIDYPMNEFMVMIEGEVVVREPDRDVSVRAGETFFIPKGTRCRWTQLGRVKKFFLIYDNPDEPVASARGRTVVLHPSDGLADLPLPLGSDEQVVYANAGGRFEVIVRHLRDAELRFSGVAHELAHVVSGALTVTAGGESWRFEQGQAFLAPRGTSASWNPDGEVHLLSARLRE